MTMEVFDDYDDNSINRANITATKMIFSNLSIFGQRLIRVMGVPIFQWRGITLISTGEMFTA
jgi:hypothetical protein